MNYLKQRVNGHGGMILLDARAASALPTTLAHGLGHPDNAETCSRNRPQ